MGVYDYICIDGAPEGAQVKCWDCTMKEIRKGDEVGSIQGEDTYFVALREGGYVEVRKGIVRGWREAIPIFDKWGEEFTPVGLASVGMFEEPYFYGDIE